MILLQSFNPTKDVIVDIDIPLIYAIRDTSTNIVLLGRFGKEDVTNEFLSLFLRMLEHNVCNISKHLFLLTEYSEHFKSCKCEAVFNIINKNFESRKMRLTGSENIAKYLRTHDVDSDFTVMVSR